MKKALFNKMVVAAGFGNPLLDITAKIPDDSLLRKYNLNKDDQKELPPNQMKSLLKDIQNLNPVLSPGGCAQNTLRILQWVLEKPDSTMVFGSIGDDEEGGILKSRLEAAGVQTNYIKLKEEPTGIAAALISGTNRSLVAYLGAAQHINIDHLRMIKVNEILKKVDLVYIEGFFLTERRPVVQYIQELCDENRVIFTFNLSSAYMSEKYPDDVIYFAEKSDILIGNQKEFEALIRATKLNIDVKEYARKLTRSYKNLKNLEYGKIIIVTNGSKSVLFAHNDGAVDEIAVPKIDPKEIGDTTGAGDAFAAGFIGGIFAGHRPIICLKWGCWVAQQIIKQVGCTIPTYPANVTQIE